MSHGKQFTLYALQAGPNPWKVAFFLNELGLSYETIYFDFQKAEHKAPEYLKLTPTDAFPPSSTTRTTTSPFVASTTRESGAILLYLAEKYDTEKKYFVTSEADRFAVLQWLFFQVSGQGPYYGQAAWFSFYHPEKLPSAVERYQNEIRRVLGVLESVLSKQEWLAAGKLTIADLSFSAWNNEVGGLLGPEFNFEKEFPATFKWHQRIVAVPGVKAGFALRKELTGY
ncbi:Glutathione S-transferase 2 [Steccherinum ochraceum]|uniref:Glutathione S-transferase 2 n=1 Tax=Steccherinum ochraceum TaxID=92696 RepID=A0A4R0RLM0_9APHY|nr:Glutathione S-transferase 2 [Steccherinum ochraceum]